MTNDDKRALVAYKYAKALDTLGEVGSHIDNHFWATAVNRLYYACFYAVSALLVDKGISVKTHAGVRQMFGLHFISTGSIDKESGKFYSDLFDMRQIGDYDDIIIFDREDVVILVEPAHLLIKSIGILIKAGNAM